MLFFFPALSSLPSIIMRFQLLLFLAAARIALAIPEDLFSENSPDTSVFQDLPQDLLAAQNLPDLPQDLLAAQNPSETSSLIADENLFSDLDTMNFPMDEKSDLFADLEAACSTENEQPLSKLRSRDDPAVCSPDDSTPLELQQLRKAWDALQNFVSGPEQEEEQSPPSPPSVGPANPNDPKCTGEFPIHLGCEVKSRLDLTDPPLRAPDNQPLYNYGQCEDCK